MADLHGSVALVTGSSSGIGAAIATSFARLVRPSSSHQLHRRRPAHRLIDEAMGYAAGTEPGSDSQNEDSGTYQQPA